MTRSETASTVAEIINGSESEGASVWDSSDGTVVRVYVTRTLSRGLQQMGYVEIAEDGERLYGALQRRQAGIRQYVEAGLAERAAPAAPAEQTTAERIAQYFEPVQIFAADIRDVCEGKRGVTIIECERDDRCGKVTRYVFADQSVIVVDDLGWGHGYTDCSCGRETVIRDALHGPCCEARIS